MLKILNLLRGDRAIWLIAILLSLVSTLVVYSSIVTLAFKHHDGNTFYYLLRHGAFLAFGFLLMYFTHNIKFNYFSRIGQIALYLAIPLLLLTMVFGENINQASRWLTIPIINQSFQTSDLAKIALLMYLARMISKNKEFIKDWSKGVLPLIVPTAIVCALIFRSNFSTSVLLFLCSSIMMFLGGVRIRHLLSIYAGIAIIVVMILSIGVYYPKVFPRAQTWVNRLENFNDNTAGDNYQVQQSKIAIASGGIFGKGPGKSIQRNFLPHPYSDFIYAIVLEEYGLVGGAFVLILYLILLFRAIKIVSHTQSHFGSLLVGGIACLLIMQALVNMSVAVNLIPVTGQTLPIVSMGGTSIWFTCLSLGMLLSVSRETDTDVIIEE